MSHRAEGPGTAWAMAVQVGELQPHAISTASVETDAQHGEQKAVRLPQRRTLTPFGMCTFTDGLCRPPNTPFLMAAHFLPGFSVDWWALGVLMFEMMAGRSPFDIITDNPDMNTEDYLFQGWWSTLYPSRVYRFFLPFSKVRVGPLPRLVPRHQCKCRGNHSSGGECEARWPCPLTLSLLEQECPDPASTRSHPLRALPVAPGRFPLAPAQS